MRIEVIYFYFFLIYNSPRLNLIKFLVGITLITAQQIKKEIILSNTWKTPSVPKNAAQIFAPAAKAAAVIKDVPPPVTPPYTRTTIGADTICLLYTSDAADEL